MFILASRLYAEEYRQSAEALFSFGEAYLKENRYADAQMELKKCLMLNPQHIQAKKLLELCQKQTALEKNGAHPELKPGVPVGAESRRLTPAAPEPRIEAGRDKTREDAMKFALEETEKKMTLPKKREVVEKNIPEEKTKVSIIEEEFPFIGGAWGIPKGHCLLESYTKYYYHNSQFDSKGKKKRWSSDGKGSEIYTELKVDYGAFDNLTLWVHIPYKAARWKDDNGELKTRGLADIWAGGKYRFLNEPLALSLQLAGKFPAGYNENDGPSLGNGQIDQEIMLLAAKPFWSLYYLRADLGYRWRYEEPADLIPYYFELGYRPLAPFDRLLLKAALDGVESISGTGETEDYTKWVTSMLFTLKKGINPYLQTKDKLDLEVGYAKTFLGKNTSAASEVFAKILYYF